MQHLSNQNLILSRKFLLDFTFLYKKNQSFAGINTDWVNHTQFNSSLDFPASEMSLVVIIGAVTGLILLMARYARPRSHIPHQGGHWDTRHKMHHMSSSQQQRAHLQCSQSTKRSRSYGVICMFSDHPCDVPRSSLLSLSAGDYRLLLSWLTGSRSRLPGSGWMDRGRAEPGARSRDPVGGMLLLGNRLIYFLMGASREKQTWVSWSCM